PKTGSPPRIRGSMTTRGFLRGMGRLAGCAPFHVARDDAPVTRNRAERRDAGRLGRRRRTSWARPAGPPAVARSRASLEPVARGRGHLVPDLAPLGPPAGF